MTRYQSLLNAKEKFWNSNMTSFLGSFFGLSKSSLLNRRQKASCSRSWHTGGDRIISVEGNDAFAILLLRSNAHTSSFLLPPPHSVTIKVLRSASSDVSGEVDTEDRPRLGNGTLSAQAGKSSANLKGFFKKSASKTSSYEGKYKDADGKEVVYKEKKDDGRVKVKVPKGAKAGDTVEFDVGGGRLAKIVIRRVQSLGKSLK